MAEPGVQKARCFAVRQTRTVTDAAFDAMVLHSTKPVVAGYRAGWCGPCPMIAPVLEEIASGYGHMIDVVTLNVDENDNTWKRAVSARFRRHRRGQQLGGTSL
jgi:thiol-disulfide isomerase/thioredoxin